MPLAPYSIDHNKSWLESVTSQLWPVVSCSQEPNKKEPDSYDTVIGDDTFPLLLK